MEFVTGLELSPDLDHKFSLLLLQTLLFLCSKLNSQRTRFYSRVRQILRVMKIWYNPIQLPPPLSRQGAPKLTLYIGYLLESWRVQAKNRIHSPNIPLFEYFL